MTKWPLRRRLNEVSDGSTYTYLKSEQVPDGQIWCLQLVGFECSEALTGTEDLRVYIEGHGYNHYLMEEDTPEADTLYWITEDMWLVPGEQLVARFAGVTSGETCDGYITGYWSKFEEGLVT